MSTPPVTAQDISILDVDKALSELRMFAPRPFYFSETQFTSRYADLFLSMLACACLGYRHSTLIGTREAVADALRCSASAVASMLKELEAKGWVAVATKHEKGCRQLTGAYVPGPALRQRWAAFRETVAKDDELDANDRWIYQHAGVLD